MSQRFFRLADDVNVPHRWHLAMPRDRQGLKVDDGQFRLGFPVLLKERLRIPVEIAGTPLDFTEAGIMIPVVHVRVASMFAELAPDDVQLIPVDVEGEPDQYLILVATRRIRCIDDVRARRGGAPRRTRGAVNRCFAIQVSADSFVRKTPDGKTPPRRKTTTCDSKNLRSSIFLFEQPMTDRPRSPATLNIRKMLHSLTLLGAHRPSPRSFASCLPARRPAAGAAWAGTLRSSRSRRVPRLRSGHRPHRRCSSSRSERPSP
jgi:hypothetical protein